MAQSGTVRGVAEAERRYGRPEVRTFDLGDAGDEERFWELWGRRQAEVLLVLQRPDGHILLQTKGFYPPGIYRLPSGGIGPGEDLVTAVRRELGEETGLPARIERFLGILHYRFRRHGAPVERASYVFLLAVEAERPRPRDEAEQITGFCSLPPGELAAVAARLQGLAGEWAPWGRFRALGHWFVAGLVRDGGTIAPTA